MFSSANLRVPVPRRAGNCSSQQAGGCGTGKDATEVLKSFPRGKAARHSGLIGEALTAGADTIALPLLVKLFGREHSSKKFGLREKYQILGELHAFIQLLKHAI
jgi:hypothetical protein